MPMHLHVLLTRYMVDVEASELLCHVDGCIVVGHQVFMLDFILPTNLVNGKLRITLHFKMSDANLFCESHSHQQRIVFHNVIGTHLS